MLIKQCKFTEVGEHKDFNNLVKIYANELSAVPDLINPDLGLYNKLEQAGVLTTYGVFSETELVGFAFVLHTSMPHYSLKMLVVESVYVKKEYRKTGAGIKLMNCIDKLGKELNAVGTIYSAPLDSTLSDVLVKKDYKPISTTYFKRNE